MPLHHSEWHGLDLSSHHLDLLYFNADKEVLKDSLKVFKKSGGLKKYKLSSTKSIDKVIHEIEELEEGKISPSLYDSYSSNLRKAVDNVFSKDTDSGLSEQLRASVSRFAAFKACTATREIKSQLTDDDYERAVTALKTYNRFQTAEYNTTVSRCRTAKQFEKFADPESTRIFPNLRWLPSRSVTPREEHQVFYNRVWSKDDPFWQKNTPGSLWNCKCDWEETDDDVTEDNPKGEEKSAQGLRGNPAQTGEVFSDDHPYFQNGTYSQIAKVMRCSVVDYAKNNLKGETITNESSGVKIKITTRGIKEFTDQPHDNFIEKNELMRKMDVILKNAKFVKITHHKGRETYVFEITFMGVVNYILANNFNGVITLYSITQSDKVLK